MAALGTRSLAKLAGVKTQTRDRAIALANYATSIGGDIGVVSGLRSYAQQAQLYADSIAKQNAGIPTLPAAKPGTSAHETGDAFDVSYNIVPDGMTLDDFQRALADYARTIGLTPGYYWNHKDEVHFQNSVIEPDQGGTASSGGSPVEIVVALAVGALALWWVAHR